MTAGSDSTDVQLTAVVQSPGHSSLMPGMWGELEIVRRLRGDKPAFGGLQKKVLLVRGDRSVIFDLVRSGTPWDFHRIDEGRALLLASELLVTIDADQRDCEICQVHIEARTTDYEEAPRVFGILQKRLASIILPPRREFKVTWAFRGSQNELNLTSVEETVDLKLADAAYPNVPGGIHSFIGDFLAAPECVLVLQGPPGTGKTQLIRGIAAAMTERRGRKAELLYANDERVLNSDEFFVKFAVGLTDALVLEDADLNLLPRSRGNAELHRMLSVSDGLIRSQGRKMIFSTNLPNLRDLDEALIRPGRCYACLTLRPLTAIEAQTLLVEISDDLAHSQRAWRQLSSESRTTHTVAEVYRALRQTRVALPASVRTNPVPVFSEGEDQPRATIGHN